MRFLSYVSDPYEISGVASLFIDINFHTIWHKIASFLRISSYKGLFYIDHCKIIVDLISIMLEVKSPIFIIPTDTYHLAMQLAKLAQKYKMGPPSPLYAVRRAQTA